jgi:hypothetical protein
VSQNVIDWEEVMPETNKEVFELYGGQVILRFNPKSHRYDVSDNGSKFEHRGSVTTILNVLNKPALLEWAKNCACNYIEENVRLLLAGNSFSVEALFKIISDGRTAHDRARGEAAEIGTSAHDYLRDYWRAVVRKTDLPTLPEEGKIGNCVGAALDFFGKHKMVPLSVEEPQYSRALKICGRPDWIGWIDDEFSVMDYKSTKYLYPEVALQMCPYAKMHEEMHGQLPIVRWGIRLDKEDGTFEARRYVPEEFDLDWDSFKCCLTIYNRMKHLRRKPKKEKDFLEGL